MIRSGDQIGPYTLISKLGRGAFGTVWLSERRTTIATTTAALKIPLDDDVDLETIKHEANLWVRASGHPNVLPIIEANVYDDQVVIASEYAPDGSLESWLKQNGGKAPSVEVAVEIVSGILAGLEHLHSRNIIHRDLKPANILFQGSTPRLADFGISRVLKSTSQSSIVAGTPAYMAPEAFDGKRNEQTDIWSVGVIFYQLLAGRLPFPQADITSLVGAILSRNPEPLPISVPAPFHTIINLALAKDANQRYKSASEMRAALRNPTESDPKAQYASTSVVTSPASPANTIPPQSPPLQPVRRSNVPHLIYAIAGLLAVLIVAIGMVTLLRSRGKDTPASESQTTNTYGVSNASPVPPSNSSRQTREPEARPTPTRTPDRVISLLATRSGWQPIGSGNFTVEVSGRIDFGNVAATPEGSSYPPPDSDQLAPGLPFGAVIAKIGNGRPFVVGYRYNFNTQEQVYLAINDSDYSDNSGSFTVQITYR